MKTRNILTILATAAALVCASSAWAVTVTTAGSGAWDSTTPNAPWPGGTVPDPGDDVIITLAHSITVPANATINSITFNNTAGAKSLSVSSGATLSVAGVSGAILMQNAANAVRAATITGAGAITAASLTVGGSTTPVTSSAMTTTLTSSIGDLTLSGNLSLVGQDVGTPDNDAILNLDSGTITVGGTVAYTQVGTGIASLNMNSGGTETGTLILAGATTFSGTGTLTFDPNGTGATVEYSGGAQTVYGAATYRNLKLSGSGTKTLQAGTTAISGNLTLSGTATATNVANLAVSGSLNVGSGTSFTVGANFTLAVTGTTTIDGALTLAGTGAKTFTGNVTIGGTGTWSETGVAAIAIAGNLQNDGAFTASTGVHTFSTAAKTISGTSEIEIPNVTVSGTRTLSGTLTVSTTLAGTSALTMDPTGVLNIGAATVAPTLTATAIGNTVNYTGGAQTVKATTYYNLIFSGNGLKSMAASTAVDGNLSIAPAGGGAQANLTAGLSLIVNSLTLGGTSQVSGTWGSTSSSATHQDNTYFASTTGILTVGATRLIVTLPNQTFTSGSGNSGSVINQTAGISFDITLTAVDANTNIDTSYSGAKTISYTGPANAPDSSPPVYTTSVTFSGGQAIGVATTLKKAEATTITATDGALTGVASSGLTVVPAATKLVFGTQPANTVNGVLMAAVTVQVQDAYGNLVSSSTAPVTLAIGFNPASGILMGTLTVNAVSGVATFSNLQIYEVGNGYTLTASADSLTGATSSAFNITQAIGDYRSAATGTWATLATWERWDGTQWATPAAAPTAANAGSIIIRSPDVVTVGAAAGGDQIRVEAGAQITINSGITFTVAAGPGTDLDVYGTVKNAGIMTMTGTATFESGGKYQHNFTTGAGTIPLATWATGSTCEIIGYTTATAVTLAGFGQTFFNVVWNCPSQSGAVALTASAATVNGDFTVTTTGSGSTTLGANVTVGGNLTVSAGTLNLAGFTINRSAPGGTFTLANGATLRLSGVSNFPGNYSSHSLGATSTVDYYSPDSQTVAAESFGHLILSGATTAKTLQSGTSIAGNLTVSFTGASSVTTVEAMSIGGNLAVGGGTLTVAGFDFSVAGTTTVSAGTLAHSSATGTKIYTGLVTISGGIWNNSGNSPITFRGGLTVSSGTFTAGSGVQTFDTNEQTVSGTLTIPNLTVTGVKLNNTGTLTVSTALAGTGELVQGTSATLNIGGTSTVTTLTATASPNTVNYSGAAQTVLPVAYHHLTLSGSGVKDTTAAVDINGTLTLTAGTFTPGADVTIAGDWTKASGAGFTPGSGTVTFDGTSAQNINGTSTSQTFNNLTVNKSTGTLTVGGSTATLALNGNLTLTAGTFAAGTATAINIAGDWSNNGGAFTPSTGTVAFTNATAAQAINGEATSQTFNNLTVNKSGQTLSVGGSTTALSVNNLTQTAGNFTAPATLAINGILTLTLGTFTAGADITIAGNWAQATAATFTPGSGTVTFTGGATTIGGTAVSQAFNNVVITKTAGTALTMGTSTTTLTVNNLTETTGDFGPPATLNINGNFTHSAGTFTANANLNIKGNWVNNGTGVSFGSGDKVTFLGTLQTVGGTVVTTFRDVVINAGAQLSLADGFSFTVNTLNIAGLAKPSGTWGSTTSAATHKNDTYFAATTGVLNVSSGTAPTPTITIARTAGSSPSTYGDSLTFTATVTGTAPTTPTGTVTFKDGATTLGTGTLSGSGASATATFTTNQLSAGTHAAITAVYSGSDDYVTVTSSALSPSQVVNARPAQLSGTRVYDGTTEVAATSLSVVNNLDGANLTLSGSATAASKDVGSQNISTRTVTRVASATGAVGTTAASSFNVTVTTPTSGNTLIAVISTRSTTANAVSSIGQSGATWSRVASTTGTAGTTTEIWYAPNVSSAGTTVTITLGSSLFAAAAVAEYSGVLSASPVDQTARATGSGTTAATGTTPTTTQGNELWIGGIGVVSSSYTISSFQNSFTAFGILASGSGTPANNAKVFGIEKIVTATGPASSGGTITSSQWSGAIATFKTTPLALAGSAASNYTLTGLSGSVTITAKPITVTAAADTKTADGETGSAGVPTVDPALVGGDTPGFIQTFDTAAAGTGKTLTPSGSVNDGNSGNNYSVTFEAVTTGTINPAAHSAFRITPSGSPTAGSDYDLTITAVDQYQNVATDVTGDHSFTFAGLADADDGTHPTVTDKTGAPVNLGTATTITFASGVSSAGGKLKAYKAETVTLTGSDTTTGRGTGDTGGTGASLTVANENPVAGANTGTRSTGTSMKILISTLLANDTDANHDTITLDSVDASSTGGATVSKNATYVFYVPNTAGNGDTFNYYISDGHGGTATGTVTVNVTPAYGTLEISYTGGATVTLSFYGIPTVNYYIQRKCPGDANFTDVYGPIPTPADGRIQQNDTPPTECNPALYRMRSE